MTLGHSIDFNCLKKRATILVRDREVKSFKYGVFRCAKVLERTVGGGGGGGGGGG